MSAPLAPPPPPPPPPPPLPPLPSAIAGTMVSSAVPSIAKQRNNYTRLCRLLIDIGTRILRGFFDSLVLHLHGDLRKHLIAPDVLSELKKLRSKRVLNTQQWDKLYPPLPGAPSSTTFDITLLFLLLRNTCGLTAPTTGWNAAPSPADLSKEADLIRVKRSRNEITGHSSEAKFSDADFESHWAVIEAALLRLGHSYCHVNDYETKIKMLKVESVDKENEAYLNILLQSWEEGEERKMDTIMEKLNEITKELHSKVGESLPEFILLPQKPSHPTINRTSEVSEIMSKIQNLQTMYPDEITVTYLSGNPGCGKSELAREIGKKYHDETDEQSKCVTTLNAANLESLTQSYMELAYLLTCSETSITTIMNSENSQEEKLVQLRGLVTPKLLNYSSWLMIVDNVEDLQLVSKFLPHAGQLLHHGKGHILITTQDSQSIPVVDPHADHMTLSRGMEPVNAVQSLYDISGIYDDDEIMHSVAKELDYQPLALACAAVYVQQVRIADPTITWQKYHQIIKQGSIESTERIFEEINNSYKKSMTRAVKLAVQTVIEKNQVMRHAFEFLAAMAPEFIALRHVVNYVMKCLPGEDKKIVAAKIIKSSLVLTSNNKDEQMVRVHQVVFNVLRSVVQGSHAKEEDELLYLTKVIDVFSYLDKMDENSIDYIKSTQLLVVHFVSFSYCVKNFFEKHKILLSEEEDKYGIRYHLNRNTTSQYRPIANVMYKDVYNVLNTHEKHEVCRILLEMGITLMAQNWLMEDGHDESNLKWKSMLINNLGIQLDNLGQHFEAKNCLDKAIEIAEAVYGSNHEELGISLSNLGNVLENLNRYEEAKGNFERALEITVQNYGNNHRNVAAILRHLGNVLSKIGKYEKAKECYKTALKIGEREHGNNHPNQAVTLSLLGNVLRELSSYKEAKECYQKALEINKSTYGKFDPKVATDLHTLGIVLSDLGSYKEAKECHQKALAINESTYGNKHPDVATSLNNLGSTLSALGSYKEAKECQQKALVIYESTYENNHPSVATSLSNLGCVLNDLGSYKEAKEYHQKALVIYESTYGNNHPSVARSLSNLGLVLSNLGSYKEAKECLQKALTIDESTYGSNHCYVAIDLGNLGMTLKDRGEYEKSKECIERAIVIDKSVLDENHPYIGIHLYKLGLSLHALGLIKEAKESFERSLTILEAAYGEDHPRVARTLNGMGQLQLEQGDNELAKQNLDRALAINETSLGANHHEVADTLNNLGRLFQSLHEYEQARRYFERALAINEETFVENHPKIAITLNNLGNLLIQLYEDKEGNHCLVRTLAIKEKNPDYVFKF